MKIKIKAKSLGVAAPPVNPVHRDHQITQRLPAGKVSVRGTVKVKQPSGVKEVVHDKVTNTNLAPAVFPSNCPMVAGEIGITLSENGTYNSIHARAYVLLPVPGFTKELVLKTQARAFELAEEKVSEKAVELKKFLKDLP